jgi:hypothetical protein
MTTEAQWRQLVRRALDVPDLIGDEVALSMVTDVVFADEVRSQPPSDDDFIGQAVWDAVVKLGVDEELDAFLTERSDPPGSLDWDWLYDRVVADARSALDDVIADARYALGMRRLPERLPGHLARSLLLRIRDFVKAHPFQDDAGRYFSFVKDAS